MSDEEMRPEVVKPTKLIKADLTIFESGNVHLKCFVYNEEGPKGKLEPWRIEPEEFIRIGRENVQYMKDFFEDYSDCGKTTDKEVVIAQMIIDVDSEFVVDIDYVLLEEMGVKHKRRPTRPGITEWKNAIESQVGDLVNSLLQSETTDFEETETVEVEIAEEENTSTEENEPIEEEELEDEINHED